MFQARKGGKSVQLIITGLGLQAVVEKRKGDSRVFPYETLASAKPCRAGLRTLKGWPRRMGRPGNVGLESDIASTSPYSVLLSPVSRNIFCGRIP
jgi:hypothetical protein